MQGEFPGPYHHSEVIEDVWFSSLSAIFFFFFLCYFSDAVPIHSVLDGHTYVWFLGPSLGIKRKNMGGRQDLEEQDERNTLLQPPYCLKPFKEPLRTIAQV